VRKYKGLAVLLAAMPKVLSKLECKLVVIGEFYDSIDKYRQLIHQLSIEPHVQVENRYVPNEEVPLIFDRADVLVLPYVSASQSAVARIALSNGLPIIASRTGGLSDAVIENVNGLLFAPGDSEALADQIISYFTNRLGPILAKSLRDSYPNETRCRTVEVIEATGQSGPSDRAPMISHGS
jgi:glycosyltransferase involved in cell wall biosynthesis